MKKAVSISLFFLAGVLIISSCKKEPGPGGQASITGMVYVDDYTSDSLPQNCIYQTSYYSPGETVYLIYGDEQSIGKTAKTDYNGTFVFDFLQPGKYKVFSYSRDLASTSNSKTLVVLKEVTIAEKKEKVSIPDLRIIK